MQKEDTLFEVYWDDEDGNTFYAGCKTKEEVSNLIRTNNLKIGNTKIISVVKDKPIDIENF